MLNFVDDVLSFLEGNKTVHGQLEPGKKLLGKPELRIVCIKLAGWWRRDVSNENRLPTLPLHDHFPWCDNLRKLHKETESMANLFVLDNIGCSYSSDLQLADIWQINQLTVDRYKPRLSVTRKRDNA